MVLHIWDVHKVADMSGMFAGTVGFNQPLNTWILSIDGDTRFMCENAKGFNNLPGQWIDTTSNY